MSRGLGDVYKRQVLAAFSQSLASPGVAVNASPHSPVSPSVISASLSFTWPLSKPQLQRVQSPGIFVHCIFSPFLKALPFWSFYTGDFEIPI